MSNGHTEQNKQYNESDVPEQPYLIKITYILTCLWCAVRIINDIFFYILNTLFSNKIIYIP